MAKQIPRSRELDAATRQAMVWLREYVDAAIAAGGGGGGVTDHGALTGLADDDHPQYHNNARGDARYEALGAVAAHAAAADPHTGYQKESEKGAASGYASLDGSVKVPIAQLPTGAVAGTVALGDDARFTDTRTPTDNTVSTVKLQNNAVDNTKLADMVTARIKGRTTAGTGDPEDLTGTQVTAMLDVATTVLKGLMSSADKTKLDGVAAGATANATDAALRDRSTHTGTQASSTIVAAATSRLLGRITAGSGAVEELTGTQATTLLDVFTSTLKGLVPGSGGGTTNFLRADGTWAAPPGGGGGSLVVQEDDVTVDSAVTTLDFGNGLDVTSSPAGEANVVVDLGEYTGADLPVTGGGTGASDAATARTNLGVGNVGTLTYPGTTTTYLRGDGTFQTLPSAALLAGGATADQTLGTGDTYVTNSNINVAGRQKVGTTIRWRLAITKTAAGTAAPVFNVRVGTAGTTADTARFAWTGVVQTAAADTAIVTIEVTIRAISASGSLSGNMVFAHKNTTTGFANAAQEQIFASVATGVDTTISPQQYGISINAGASSAWTVNHCSVEAINLS